MKYLFATLIILNIFLVTEAQTKSQLKNFGQLPNESAKWLALTEATNGEYLQFIQTLRQSGNTAEATRWLPDTTKWTVEKNQTPLADYYFSHPAFDKYPVVNVSHEAAVAFCNWLTDQYNQINGTGKGAFKKVRVRLPTQTEWQQAARGDITKNASSTAEGEPELPWAEFPYWNYPDAKGKFKANTRFETHSPSMPFAYHLDGFVYTAPVKSYAPSDYGFFDLIGNVAEMVDEPGKAVGGSWSNTIDECFISKHVSYQGTTPTVGFRLLLEVVTD
jgi:formylglycine-generating enzyme required for sulfatase activity